MSQHPTVCRTCGIEFLGIGRMQTADAKCPGCRALDALTQGRGTVRWFDPRRGYGFIRSAQEEDVFFHHSDLRMPPQQVLSQVPVTFLLERTDRGLEARQVRIGSTP